MTWDIDYQHGRTPQKFSLLADMVVERGNKDDWNLLHELHYKADNLASGSRFWRLRLGTETIGVLVSANPKGLLKERHLAFPKIKPGHQDTYLTNVYRYEWINAYLRVISRLVLDTPYRGIGAGYRFMNLVARMENRWFVEIQSSMSKHNLFGQGAGFTFVQPMHSAKFEKGVKFLRCHFGSNPQDFEAIVEELDAMPLHLRAKTVAACKDFYSRNSALENTGAVRGRGDHRIDALTPRLLIKAMQQMILASPLYGIWENPDWFAGCDLHYPEQLPLIAFDEQGPNEKLKRLGAG